MNVDVHQTTRLLPCSRVHAFCKLVGIVVVFVGLAVLAGWMLDIQALKRIYPGLASMKPNTALALVLCGFALCALQGSGYPRRARVRGPLAVAASATAFLVGLLTLFEYFFHWRLEIDELLFRDFTAGEPFPGRMSPLSALNFILIGTALLLLAIDKPIFRRWSRVAACLSALIALMALFGYAYSITLLYRPSSYTGVALHTALAFFLLSLGILCAHPDEGLVATLLKRSPGGTVMRRAAPISLAAAFLLGWLRLEGQRMGLFDTEMGVALLVVSACAIFVLSTAWAARTVDAGAELRAAKQQLTEMLQLMVERIPEYAVIMLDPAGNIATWNLAAEGLKGYRAEQIVGKHFSILYSPEDVAGNKPARELEIAVRKGVYEDEGWRLRRDGSRFWASVVITSLRDEHGDLRGFGKITRDLTERKRAEDQFRMAVEAAPTGMIMVDQRGKIVLLNAQIDKLFGYDRAELMGQSIEVLVPERFRGRHAGFRTNFSADPVARPMGAGRDLYGLRKNGTEMPIEIALNPLETMQGKFVLSSVVDITERKRFADQFRLALEAAPTGMIMVDQQGKIVLLNAQIDKLFGYGRAELMGQSIEVLVPERFRDRHPGFRTNFFTNPKTRPMGAGRDLYGLRKDGTEMPIEIGLTPLETPEGRFVLSSVVDITERKQAAANQFRLAIEAAPTGMILTDQRGGIVLVNAQVDKLFGYDRSELMGQSIELLMPERFREKHVNLRTNFSRHPHARPVASSHRLYGLRKDGTEMPVEIGLNPLETPEGKFVLSSVVDITERKRAEEEREDLLARLQTTNVELGSTLKEREVLLQEIHHRVKNNLQVISSLINLQLRRIENAASRQALQECQTRVQTIALIHEMLYRSKDYSTIRFSEYARSLAANVFRAAGVTTDAISMELEIDDVSLGVDKAIPCGLILNELIINAVKHAFPNGRQGIIRIELRRVKPGTLVLAVRDNGVGLPTDMDVRKSHSLGMNLVSTLAEQLGTELEIIRGEGTTFQFNFAVDEEASSTLPLPAFT